MNIHYKFIGVAIAIMFCFIHMSSQAAHNSQFSYTYPTEIVYNNHQGFVLNPAIEAIAIQLNKHLNQSILFDTAFIRDPEKVRAHHLKNKPAKDLVGQEYEVITDDGVRLGATYFDRNSNKLLIIGTGFTNEREVMSPFIAMFPDYDVVIFDFRGHGFRPCLLTNPSTWCLNPTKKFFGIDGNLVRFGHDEDKDVYAVVDGFKKVKYQKDGKAYTYVFGLGLCYGAFILSKTAAVYPGIFDKLIVDGCWLSLERYIAKIKGDLKTLCNPQTGGWQDHFLFSKSWLKNSIEYLARNFLLEINDISLADYAPKIDKTPILFFHGKDDYMVYRDEFEQLWNLSGTKEKTAIITSNHHVRNHLKQKEVYKMVCDLFLELPQPEFIKCLCNPEDLTEFYANKITKLSRG